MSLTWPPNPEPDIAGYFIYYGASSDAYTNVLDVGNVTSNTVPGLVEGVTYYFMVTAYDSIGLESAPSSEVSYTVPPTAPTQYRPVAGTLAATVSGSSGAVLNGAVNPNGAATVAWFEYGSDNRYGWTTGMTNLGSGTSTLWVNSSLAGLLAGGSYHYRIVASNSLGVTNGTDMTFTLSAALPTVSTQPATALKETTATLNGSVNPNGGATVVWFQYGTNSAYTSTTAAMNVPAGNSVVPIYVALTGLQPGVTYYYRVAANNSAGMSYGPDVSFATAQIQTAGSVTLAWPANPEPDIAGYNVYYGVASGIYTNAIDVGNVTNYTLSGLVPGVRYFFNVTAYDSLDLESAFSGEISVMTGPAAGQPLVGTVTATPDSATSALLYGQINPNGAATTAWFEYGLDTNYGRTIGTTALGSGTSFLSLNFYVGSLLPGLTYHYRLVASNSQGVTRGNDATFTTSIALPSVATQTATGVSSDSAVLNAAVNPNGDSTTVYFEYGLDTTYGLITDSSYVPAGNSAVPISIPASELLAGAVYHYRVVAKNTAGKTVGLDATFITSAQAPGVTTYAPDGIGLDAANFNGDVDPNGSNTTAWFEYGLDANYGAVAGLTPVGSADGDIAFSTPVGNLLSGTTYHYRFVASNVLGVAYGKDVSFTTLSTDVDVTTLPATSVGSSRATLQGAVDPNGTPTGAWFQYGLTTNYEFSTAAINLGQDSNFVSISCVLSNLSPGQTWHYRMVATNSSRLQYGADMMFDLPMTDLAVVTLPAKELRKNSAKLAASVTPVQYSAKVYFRYGVTTNLTSVTGTVSVGAGNNPVTVNKGLSGLLAGTTYYYRVVASNKYDVVYGQIVSFTTQP